MNVVTPRPLMVRALYERRQASQPPEAMKLAGLRHHQPCSKTCCTENSLLHDFCQKSSLHGLQYVGDNKRPFVERLFWVVSMILSLLASLYLIGIAWKKWNDSPVILSFEGKLRPVWEVPLPAVTVCPEVKIRKTLFDFSKVQERAKNNSLTPEEQQLVDDRHLLCIKQVERSGKIRANISSIDNIEKLSPQMNEVLTEFSASFTQPLLTKEGLCFSFNMLAAHELFPNTTFHGSRHYLRYPPYNISWTVDGGYTSSASAFSYPRRVLGMGRQAGVELKMSLSEADFDSSCNGVIQGFKVIIHNPAEVPLLTEEHFWVPLDREVVVITTPELITTSAGLKDYSPHIRQCYFSYERKLKYFKFYTQENCILECLTNYTLKKCGCAGFYMPRDVETPVCGSGRRPCERSSPKDLFNEELKEGIKSGVSRSKCNCLQSCTDLQYQNERSETALFLPSVQAHPEYKSFNWTGQRLAWITVFVKNANFIARRRSELYGSMDFLVFGDTEVLESCSVGVILCACKSADTRLAYLSTFKYHQTEPAWSHKANCGGLLGLGLGLSALSLIEVIYWICFRVRFMNYKTKASVHDSTC